MVDFFDTVDYSNLFEVGFSLPDDFEEPQSWIDFRNHYIEAGSEQYFLSNQAMFPEKLYTYYLQYMSLDPLVGEAHQKLLEIVSYRGIDDSRMVLQEDQALQVADALAMLWKFMTHDWAEAFQEFVRIQDESNDQERPITQLCITEDFVFVRQDDMRAIRDVFRRDCFADLRRYFRIGGIIVVHATAGEKQTDHSTIRYLFKFPPNTHLAIPHQLCADDVQTILKENFEGHSRDPANGMPTVLSERNCLHMLARRDSNAWETLFNRGTSGTISLLYDQPPPAAQVKYRMTPVPANLDAPFDILLSDHVPDLAPQAALFSMNGVLQTVENAGASDRRFLFVYHTRSSDANLVEDFRKLVVLLSGKINAKMIYQDEFLYWLTQAAAMLAGCANINVPYGKHASNIKLSTHDDSATVRDLVSKWERSLRVQNHGDLPEFDGDGESYDDDDADGESFDGEDFDGDPPEDFDGDSPEDFDGDPPNGDSPEDFDGDAPNGDVPNGDAPEDFDGDASESFDGDGDGSVDDGPPPSDDEDL